MALCLRLLYTDGILISRCVNCLSLSMPYLEIQPPLLDTWHNSLINALVPFLYIFFFFFLPAPFVRLITMSLPLLPSILPPEIRSRIFVLLNNKNLAKDFPEVFWAIAPDYLRDLSIGKNFNFHTDRLQTQLVEIYPTCGAYVQKLTLFTDATSVGIITKFLESFPLHRKLKHLRIEYSLIRRSFWSAESLPYHNLLECLLATSPTLTRLSFSNLEPSSSLITSSPTLTHLDIGHYIPLNIELSIPLPSQLEILSVTPAMVQYICQPLPLNLRVLIVVADFITPPAVIEELQSYIAQAPSLTSIALVDICVYSFFFFNVLKLLNNYFRCD